MSRKQKNKTAGATVGLSTKNYKPGNSTASQKPTHTYVDTRGTITLSKGARIAVAVTAAVLLVAIIAGIILLVLNYKERNYRINYPYEDLSPFISIDKSAYDGYTVTVAVPEITDGDLENAILQVLAQKKGDLLYDGGYYSDAELGAGDTAYIWYRGYELDENGKRTEPSGTCNFYGTSSKALDLGSGSFIAGFELGLVGHKMSDSSLFVKRTSGDVLDGDIVYLTGTCSQETGDFYSEANIRIDLSDPEVESTWGVGIADYLKEIGIGGSSTGVKELVTPAGDHIIYTGITVQFTTTPEGEASPIVVKTVFPHDYETESFRNKTVYFEVYIEKTLHYETAELNDELIESLGFSAEKLAEYEGETLADKYRSRILKALQDERQAKIDALVEEAVMDNLLAGAEVKKIPQGDRQDLFDFFYYQLEMEYISSLESPGLTSSYENVESYLLQNFGLQEGDDWREYLYGVVDQDIKEKMVVFYVIYNEGLMPTEEEYQAEYRRILMADYEKNYGRTRKDFATDELYESALARYESQMKQGYGETYFFDRAYSNLCFDDIVAMANVVNTAVSE